VSVRSWFCVLAVFAASARAHDPYEITSAAYVRTNVIELFIEMEFPAGMRLAGIEPARDVAISNQVERARPQLAALAGSFFDFTAGNNKVAALNTNVTLGIDDHIQFKLEYQATPLRPLQFVARRLRAVTDSPYGASLTVLDMVNQKVLGQATLFADSPPAVFPPPALAVEINPPASPRVIAPITASSSATPVAPPARSAPGTSLIFIVGLAVTLFLLLRPFFRR
jgi:hypothetical protein